MNIISNRVIAIEIMRTLVEKHKIASYVGRVVVPLVVAYAMRQVDKNFDIGWLTISEVDTRYITEEGDYSSYRAVFLTPPNGDEYSFESLPFYIETGFTSSSLDWDEIRNLGNY